MPNDQAVGSGENNAAEGEGGHDVTIDLASAAGEYNDGLDDSRSVDMSKDFNDIPDEESPDQDAIN